MLAMNPCPCGHYLGASGRCRCQQREIDRYLRRLSGPLLDRVDIQLQLDAVDPVRLGERDESGTTQRLRAGVLAAREAQWARFGGLNAHVSTRLMREAGRLGEPARICLVAAATDHQLSARGYHRIIRVARTVADLAGAATIEPEHVLQAVMLRCSVRL